MANEILRLQGENFTDIYAAAKICDCLKFRNMCKTVAVEGQLENEEEQLQGYRVRKRKGKQKSNCRHNNLPYIKNTKIEYISNACKYFPNSLYSNLLQYIVGSLVWHITASTAISIFATIYFFMANTQGATAAVLALTTSSSLPKPTMASSLSASLAIYTSLAAPMPSPSSLNVLQPATTTIATNLSFYSSSFLDLNYNINSTEITILNGVSSLPAAAEITTTANTVSGYINDNNSNNNNNNYNNVITVSYNSNAISLNDSLDDMSAEDASEYIFDRTDVRIIFITLYTMVFCCCFFGKYIHREISDIYVSIIMP